MKKALWYILSILTFALLSTLWGIRESKKGEEKLFILEIKGTIQDVWVHDRGCAQFTLFTKGESIRSSLSPSINENYNPNDLCFFLRPYDSIVKPAYQDTLFIYRLNEEYFFILGEVVPKKDSVNIMR